MGQFECQVFGLVLMESKWSVISLFAMTMMTAQTSQMNSFALSLVQLELGAAGVESAWSWKMCVMGSTTVCGTTLTSRATKMMKKRNSAEHGRVQMGHIFSNESISHSFNILPSSSTLQQSPIILVNFADACLERKYICDGSQQYPYNEEVYCWQWPCFPDQFKCGSVCLELHQVCNGVGDCYDQVDADEQGNSEKNLVSMK